MQIHPERISKYLAIHLAPNIQVNCVIPGAVQTPATERAIPTKDLMDAKIYTTAGDYVTVELFKKFGFNAVPVSETDI